MVVVAAVPDRAPPARIVKSVIGGSHRHAAPRPNGVTDTQMSSGRFGPEPGMIEPERRPGRRATRPRARRRPRPPGAQIAPAGEARSSTTSPWTCCSTTTTGCARAGLVVDERPVRSGGVPARRLDHVTSAPRSASSFPPRPPGRSPARPPSAPRAGPSGPDGVVTGSRRAPAPRHRTPLLGSSSISAGDRPSSSPRPVVVLPQARRAPAMTQSVSDRCTGSPVDPDVPDLGVVRRGPQSPLRGRRVVVDPVLGRGDRGGRDAGGRSSANSCGPGDWVQPSSCRSSSSRWAGRPARSPKSRRHGPVLVDHRRDRRPSPRRRGRRWPPTSPRPRPGRCRAAPSRVCCGWNRASRAAAAAGGSPCSPEFGTGQGEAGLGAGHVDPLALAGAVAVDEAASTARAMKFAPMWSM